MTAVDVPLPTAWDVPFPSLLRRGRGRLAVVEWAHARSLARGPASVTARRRTARPKPKAPVSTHPVRRLSAADQRLVERVRRICLRLPEANERISHGEPTWFAGKGKVFAMIDGHHHDSPH